ncbi:MAG: polysaccharide deacetylase family protein, partial [Candidatus Cybelea sp.]
LLDVLRDLRVPATFFLIGRDAETWPELTRRIEAEGNEIADHTFTHPNLDQESDDQVRDEILKGRDVLWDLSRDPAVRTLMRPPHGRYNERTLQVAQSLGYSVVLWTDDGGDWRSVTVDELERHLVEHATAPEIVLLHSGKLATIEALPFVVDRFRKAGYRFVTVGEMLKLVQTSDLNHPLRKAV